MDIVEQLRKHQCPENKGCNPVVDYCQCALMDSGAAEIERLRKERDDYKAVLERIAPYDIQGWVHQALIRHSTKGH